MPTPFGPAAPCRGSLKDVLMSEQRAAQDVLEDHLRLGQEGTAEEDLPRNFATDVVVLTRDGVHRGHGGLRRLAERLRREVPNMRIAYKTKVIEGEFGFLEWTAEGDGAWIEDGADSYVVRDKLIVAQTIHYTVKDQQN